MLGVIIGWKWLVLGIVGIGLVGAVLYSIIVLPRVPRNDRAWEHGQERIPRIMIEGAVVTVENLRDFLWDGPYNAAPRYRTQTYDLTKLQTLDVVVSHFANFEGIAHSFLSFGFADGQHISISFEARREAGEAFSPVRGLLRNFEAIYVVATDRDMIGVRTGPRRERVYIYPTVATPAVVRALFVRIVRDINILAESPRFYNTLTYNCTNTIAAAAEDVTDLRFSRTKLFFPGYAAQELFAMGILADTDSVSDFATYKVAHFVSPYAPDWRDEDFAVKIRSRIGSAVK